MSIDRRRFLAGGAAAAGLAAVPGASAASPARPAAAAPPAGAPRPARPSRRRRGIRTGVERLIADGYRELAGQRVGMLTNPTGVLRDLRHEVDVLAADRRVELTAVFGPEHGFRGTAQAGGSEGYYDDPRTGLPVYDTYGKSGRALADVITASGVDTVVFDIQDAGARFYTYIWTLYDSMVAAAMAGKRFVVLDRPNPISGRAALGPVMHAGYETFVGRKPISQQHGMTVAELARMYNGEWVPADAGRPVELAIVAMDGWRRDSYFEQTGLPWVPPSPNMPTVDTAVVYPGTCMFEGTNLSEGRGTTRPFEEIAAPYGDWHWREALAALELPGVAFREAYFAPTFSKWAGRTIGGVQVYVTDRHRFDAIRTTVAMLVTLKRRYPNDFGWRSDNWIDKLTGSDQVRRAVDAGAGADEIVAGWRDDLAAFRRLRQHYLIYREER